ncbi:UvrD-helicase domain-containing protein [Kineococcus sp. SYSU DK004]|uniref:UvrD-helicase domain-containing protein n=1 Tax=Kineococcus sp. SYSU DK004 TaxID=3383125 RepID=UPI003D7C375D
MSAGTAAATPGGLSGGLAGDVPVFDLTGPLPRGTTVLEASAGTGKTYTIAGLVTRYVAEGAARVEELLVVTFGRAATGELRSRVRERLVAARDALADPAAARRHRDPVVRALAQPGGDADDEVVAQRRARLAAAVASFDAATVATLHQFCQQVLTGLGTGAHVDPGAVLVEDLSDVLEQVCDDLYLRFAGYAERTGAGAVPFDRDAALAVARAAVAHPLARLEPASRTPGSPADLRVRFAAAVRAEVQRRKESQRTLSFDDLLVLLGEALADPVTGPVARERLRSRYRVVLVDEFQDTDGVQWEVLRRAFHGHVPLVLIGDPKQAIYAFRGADVRTYLEAAGAADARATLGTNFRSDPALLDGVQGLLRGAVLGEEGIVVRGVRAAHEVAALLPADPAPVQLRVLPRTGLPTTRAQGLPVVGAVRAAVAADVAEQVVEVLASGAQVRRPRDDAAARPRPLSPGDVAVLVRTRPQAVLVQEALRRRGVPCVLARGPSVFGTPAARDWLCLLEALEQPHRAPRVRRLALSSFVGADAARLAADGAALTDAQAERLRAWAPVLAARGVAGLFAAVAEEQRLAERLLALEGGERLLTDLRHIAETLHAEALRLGLGLASLLSWLRARVEEAAGDLDQERSRRLDTDRAAVQVATVHASKGLEFEVVLVPFAWDEPGGGPRDRLPVAHGPDGARVLHVGGPGSPGLAEVCAAEDAEGAGEELRLLYVALTRAVSRLLVWWAPSSTTPGSPLHRLLLADDPAHPPRTVPLPGDAEVLARLGTYQHHGSGVRVVPVGPLGTATYTPPREEVAALAPASFDRDLDAAWRRTSYSGLTRAAHEAAHPAGGAPGPLPATSPRPARPVASEVERGARDDEGDVEDAGTAARPTGAREEAWHAVPSPMADLPGGAGFGTVVHGVLEHFDPAVPDRRTHLAALARAQDAGALAEPLADALPAALATGLGPLADGVAWQDVPVADRLAELEFELPLAGGDRAGQRAGAPPRLGEVADLLRRHLGADDPVRPYAEALEEPVLAAEVVSGYLTGSIDAVLRRGTGASARYLVVDHKTNRLAGPGEALTAWHYRRAALDEAVREAHYPLQALLYCVALHRYLRWRQPGYDPEVHLGGVLYLFLRGMCGPGVEAEPGQAPPGVWSWRPPAALVLDLSDLLAGRRP